MKIKKLWNCKVWVQGNIYIYIEENSDEKNSDNMFDNMDSDEREQIN